MRRTGIVSTFVQPVAVASVLPKRQMAAGSAAAARLVFAVLGRDTNDARFSFSDYCARTDVQSNWRSNRAVLNQIHARNAEALLQLWPSIVIGSAQYFQWKPHRHLVYPSEEDLWGWTSRYRGTA